MDTALLALSSSVLPAHANGMESFDYSLSITFDDPDAGKITGADRKIIEDAVVTSFNNVHDTSVIKLESFKLSSFKPGSVLSKIFPGYPGGSYSYGGGKGNNCRMCGSDDLLTDSAALVISYDKWEAEMNKILANSGSPGVAKASNVVIKVDDDESDALSEVDSDMEAFDYSLSITFDDPEAAKITGADEKIIEDAVVTSFNNVHDTSVVELESSKLSSFKPGISGYLGGSYSYGGGKGNNCRMCGNDDMMLSADMTKTTHAKWQTELNKILAGSGSPDLAEVTNVVIKVDGDDSGFLAVEADDRMEEFDYILSVTFDDPDASKITGADKKFIEDAVVTAFNNVHDIDVIMLETFKLSSFKPGTSGYLGGSYSYGGGKGNNCLMCGSDDLLTDSATLAISRDKWQTELNKILAGSGSPALADATNVVIKVDGDESVALSGIHSDMEEFTFNVAISFNDPEAAQATDADKTIFSDCVVSSFNDFHDTSIITLTEFDMTEWEASTGMLSFHRGSTANNYVGGS